MYSMEKLKQIRRSYNYTVYDMASKLNISASFYSQLENKRRRLFYEMAINISRIFNMKPDDIFYTNN